MRGNRPQLANSRIRPKASLNRKRTPRYAKIAKNCCWPRSVSRQFFCHQHSVIIFQRVPFERWSWFAKTSRCTAEGCY